MDRRRGGRAAGGADDRRPANSIAREAARDPALVVLDVRTPEEFAAGHVPGAINVPHDQLEGRLAELAPLRDKDVVVYCKSGRRSALALEVLGRNGYTRLRHLEGDMPAWEAGGPAGREGRRRHGAGAETLAARAARRPAREPDQARTPRDDRRRRPRTGVRVDGRGAPGRRAAPDGAARAGGFAIGFVTNFLDTLGIGSFAPTTAALQAVPDGAGRADPGDAQRRPRGRVDPESLIFVTTVGGRAALLVGDGRGGRGRRVVRRRRRRAAAAARDPAGDGGGTADRRRRVRRAQPRPPARRRRGDGSRRLEFAVAVGASVVLGGLMTIGIGMYAPTMILLALMGMHPIAAFPVMMGACALLMPVAGVRFVRSGGSHGGRRSACRSATSPACRSPRSSSSRCRSRRCAGSSSRWWSTRRSRCCGRRAPPSAGHLQHDLADVRARVHQPVRAGTWASGNVA